MHPCGQAGSTSRYVQFFDTIILIYLNQKHTSKKKLHKSTLMEFYTKKKQIINLSNQIYKFIYPCLNIIYPCFKIHHF